MNYLYTYLSIGLGYYLYLAVTRFHTFKGASFMGVVRGFLGGVLFWPVVAYFLFKHEDCSGCEDEKCSVEKVKTCENKDCGCK